MQKLIIFVIGWPRASMQSFKRQVGIESNEQVAFEDESIAERTSWMVAGAKDEIGRGGESGGVWGDGWTIVDCEKAVHSLATLFPKKLRKDEASLALEVEKGSVGGDFWERRESRASKVF